LPFSMSSESDPFHSDWPYWEHNWWANAHSHCNYSALRCCIGYAFQRTGKK
jgi:hypothetical protein